MQYQLTLYIPDYLGESIRSMANFEQFVNDMIVEVLQKSDTQRKQRLRDAAKLMAVEYAADNELTVFTALDSEPVYAS